MTMPAEQADVAAFLTRLSGVEPKETPISAVFLSADMAWKLKKAVRPRFLGFSTSDRRRHFLERELAIKQPAVADGPRERAEGRGYASGVKPRMRAKRSR